MHGTGQFTFPDGTEYIGEFQNGLQHGMGLLTTTDGLQNYGEWVNGECKTSGYNVILDKDGELIKSVKLEELLEE